MNNTKIEELMNDLFVSEDNSSSVVNDESFKDSNNDLFENKNNYNELKNKKFDVENSENQGVSNEEEPTEIEFDDIDIGEELRKKYAELFADDDNAEF